MLPWVAQEGQGQGGREGQLGRSDFVGFISENEPLERVGAARFNE